MKRVRAPVSREDLLRRAVAWVLLLTGVNAMVCVLQYELGFGPATFLFGPSDRFADLIKVGLSYKALVAPHLSDAKLASWPEIFRAYYLANPYSATLLQASSAQVTNLHLPPLGQLIGISAGLLTAVLPSPVWTLVAFFVAYLAIAAGAVGGALPRGDRSAPVLGAAALLLLFSYPALFLLTRANFHSGLASLGVMGFCLTVYRRRSVPLGALLMLAVAANLRPNVAVFALAIPLLLGVRASLPYLARLAILSTALFIASLGIASWLNPEYGLGSFLTGLGIYGRLYVAGPYGDAFNSSLLSLLKVVGGRRVPVGVLLGIFNVLAIALIALTWIAARTGRLRASAVCFLLTACYALCTPVFGDYHLLVFIAPLLLLHLEAGGEAVGWDAVAASVAVASVLLLSAKNLGSWRGHSFQVVLNPLIVLGAMIPVLRQGMGPGAPADPVEA